MKRRYLHNPPPDVCMNCVNGVHKACSDPKCGCRKAEHNDSKWRVDLRTYRRFNPSTKPKKKPASSTILRKRMETTLEALCRFIVKERAGWKCELAGKDGINCSEGKPKEIMQWAHLITRGASKSLKFDLENAVCLCSGHHTFYTHRSDLWPDICKKFFPKKWEHSNRLKWQGTDPNFSYAETLAAISLEAAKLKKGI
jgi:hypothetical protein